MAGGMAKNFRGMKLGISKYFRTKFGVSSMNTKKDTEFGKIAFKKTTYFFKKNYICVFKHTLMMGEMEDFTYFGYFAKKKRGERGQLHISGALN